MRSERERDSQGKQSGFSSSQLHRAGFCWWWPGANIEDGSSLTIHWSSGSHKRSTNWANQYDIYFGGDPYWWGPGSWPPWTPEIRPCQFIVEGFVTHFDGNVVHRKYHKY